MQILPRSHRQVFDDSSWLPVGLPYSSEQMNMYINLISGDGDGQMGPNEVWYRKHFTMDPQYANSKVQVELEGVHTGMQVYVNGVLLPGSSAVAADNKATHVIGFIGALVDITPYLHFDGSGNVLAVRAASRDDSWFESPGFSGSSRFGQAMNGIFRPVRMYITDPVYIPRNTYSGYNAAKWGTYVSTLSASDTSATIDVQTNVMNESTSDQDVFLTTQIVDAGRKYRGHCPKRNDDSSRHDWTYSVVSGSHLRSAVDGKQSHALVPEQQHLWQALYV